MAKERDTSIREGKSWVKNDLVGMLVDVREEFKISKKKMICCVLELGLFHAVEREL